MQDKLKIVRRRLIGLTWKLSSEDLTTVARNRIKADIECQKHCIEYMQELLDGMKPEEAARQDRHQDREQGAPAGRHRGLDERPAGGRAAADAARGQPRAENDLRGGVDGRQERDDEKDRDNDEPHADEDDQDHRLQGRDAHRAARRDDLDDDYRQHGGYADGARKMLKFPPTSALPKFTEGVSNILLFLDESEQVYVNYGLPKAHWVNCLTTQIVQASGAWRLVSNALRNNATWAQVTKLFYDNFDGAGARSRASVTLALCTQKGRRVVDYYLDYTTTARAADADLENYHTVQRFLRGLSPDLSKAVSTELRPLEKAGMVTIADVYSTALHHEALETQAVEYKGQRRQDHGKGRPDAAVPRTEVKRDYCNYCKRLGHSTAECRTKARDEGKPKDAVTPPAQGSKGGKSYDIAKVQCHACDQYGHYASSCPNKGGGAKKPDVKKVRMLKLMRAPTTLDDDDDDSISDGDWLPWIVGDIADDSDDADDKTAMKRQEEVRRVIREASAPLDLLAPILVNDERVQALIDSGAQTSVISTTFCQQKMIPVREAPAGSTLRMADEAVIPRLGTAKVTIRAGSRTAEVEVEVMHIRQPFIVGLDLFAKLNFSVHGLPVQYPADEAKGDASGSYDIQGTSLADDVDDYLQSVWRPEDRIDKTGYDWVTQGVAAAMETNAAIPKDVFCTHPSATVAIDTGDADPVYRSQYPCPVKLEPLVDDKIKQCLERGIIGPAPRDTQWNSPLHVVMKKDSLGRINPDAPTIRVCIDTRAINALLKDRPLRIPLIEDLFKRLQGFAVASALDLEDGYHQVRVEDVDQPKLTFRWKNKCFMYKRAPFGLKIMVPFFQGMMETILEPCLAFCLVYLDDIVVYTVPRPGATAEECAQQHARDLKAVIELLTSHNIRLNIKKCHIGFKRLRVLGHILTGEGRSVDPEKLTTLQSFPRPTTGKQMMSFLGFVNYMRDYIPLYSALAAPLEALRNLKNIEEAWSKDPRCEQSFRAFLNVLQKAPALHFPVADTPFYVYTDASDNGVGAVLCQKVDGKERYISFVSKALNSAQRNYSATKRECLAIMFALLRFREYLLLTHFELFTDHRALTFMMTQKQLSPMLAEWSETLLQFDFTVTHLPGASNVLADALSRAYPDFVWEERGATGNAAAASAEGDDDGKEQRISAMQIVEVQEESGNAAPTAAASGDDAAPAEQKQSGKLIKVSEVVKHPQMQLAEFINERMQKKMPEKEERHGLLEQAHIKGHYGAEELYLSLWHSGVYWPEMKKDCEEIVGDCAQCLRFNTSKRGFHPQQSIYAAGAFDHVAIDNFKMESTSPRGINYVLVLVDIATRFVLLAPLENERATTIARRLWEWFCTFGVPKIIQSDNGTAFVNKVVGKMLKMMGVDHRLVAAYNPRANGAAERHVKTAKDTLLKLCEGNVVNFDLFLPAVQFAINTKMARLHKSAPFSLMFARKATLLHDHSNAESKPMTVEEMLARNKCMLDIVFPTIETSVRKALKKRDKAADASRTLIDDIPGGAQVMIKDLLRASKAEPRWVGPYTVQAKVGSSSYRLQDATGEEFKRLVPVDQIKVISTKVDPADIEPTYVVDRVTDHRKNADTGATEYLVKWKYGVEDSWEPLSSFDDNDPIRRYWAVREMPVEQLQDREPVGKRGRAKQRKAMKDKKALVPRGAGDSSDEDVDAGVKQKSEVVAAAADPEPVVITGRFGRKRTHANPFRMQGAV